ncbi:hypothetical protein KN811_20575, partial [Sinomicrobium sp. 2019215]|nr:hypothetical protein [Sinomicrobium weinanense]
MLTTRHSIYGNAEKVQPQKQAKQKMNNIDNIKKRTSQNWELKNIQISHNLIEYHSFDKIRTANDTNCVRL